MLAALIFTIALVAMVQFGLFYWRAVMTSVATLPISSRVLEAAHVSDATLSGADFAKLASLYALTPELKSGDSSLRVVQFYYDLLESARGMFGQLSPAVANWSARETALCARYAAVQIERRLQSNLAQAADMRSC